MPSASARICTSMWRGLTTACSRNTVASPNADSASRMAASIGVAQVLGSLDPAHAAPAAARDRLDEDREADVVGRRDQRVDVGGRARWSAAPATPASRAAAIARALLPVRCSTSAGGPTNVMPASAQACGEIGVLREEAVAGVDRVGARPAGRLDHLVDREVRADRVARLADLVRLVGLRAVQGVAVLVREDRHRGDAELVGGAERADGDLTPVGDQHLAEHGGLPRVAVRDSAISAGTLPGGTRSDPCERHPGGVPRRRAPPSSPGGDAAVPAGLRRRVRRWAAAARGGLARRRRVAGRPYGHRHHARGRVVFARRRPCSSR